MTVLFIVNMTENPEVKKELLRLSIFFTQTVIHDITMIIIHDNVVRYHHIPCGCDTKTLCLAVCGGQPVNTHIQVLYTKVCTTQQFYIQCV